MSRNTIILATLALIIVALATPFELVGIPLASLAALAIGAVAGWWACTARGEGSATRGAGAGAIADSGALLGSIIGLAVLALIIGNIPEVQEAIRASEPHPDARIPTSLIVPIAALGGMIGGFVLGLIDLALAAVGGLVAALIYGRNHPAPA
jgi:uncharacterized membrane-anchored protein YitT (DUF2179 family)